MELMKEIRAAIEEGRLVEFYKAQNFQTNEAPSDDAMYHQTTAG
jgi:queuine/archaeosine tRNA-ribosyltransferase